MDTLLVSFSLLLPLLFVFSLHVSLTIYLAIYVLYPISYLYLVSASLSSSLEQFLFLFVPLPPFFHPYVISFRPVVCLPSRPPSEGSLCQHNVDLSSNPEPNCVDRGWDDGMKMFSIRILDPHHVLVTPATPR